jgi:uncharacterized protein YukE
MSADRLRKKEGLDIQLVLLFGPILHLLFNPDAYDRQEAAETTARFFAEHERLKSDFSAFCTGQSGHSYSRQELRFRTALTDVAYLLRTEDDNIVLREKVQINYFVARNAITDVPIPRKTMPFLAHTPYSTYRALRALCATEATHEVIWVDPYFDVSIFDRYIGDMSPTITVTLVTAVPRTTSDRRWTRFLDVSRLYGKERDSNHYRLIVHQDGLHDRWVLFDRERLYSMGGSVKDAGDKQYFTLQRLDAAPESLGIIDSLIASGTEYFGPSTPKHK